MSAAEWIDKRRRKADLFRSRYGDAAGVGGVVALAAEDLPRALDALGAVLTFATTERDKISRTYVEQPGTARAGYANAMDDVIRTIEAALGAQ